MHLRSRDEQDERDYCDKRVEQKSGVVGHADVRVWYGRGNAAQGFIPPYSLIRFIGDAYSKEPALDYNGGAGTTPPAGGVPGGAETNCPKPLRDLVVARSPDLATDPTEGLPPPHG